MQLSEMDQVKASFERCNRDCEFIDHFYQCFMESSPEATARFAGVDMDHQVVMMRASLEMLLREVLDPQALAPLAELHSRRGVNIPPNLYELWLQSLLSTVQIHDPQCDEALLTAWRNVLSPGIEAMVRGY